MVLAFCGLVRRRARRDEPKTITQILDGGVKTIESEFVPAAEAMPEDKYGFAPTAGEFKGVRTFAQQVKHVAAVNYMVAAAILGEKPPVELGGENGPDSMKSKADIVKFAKDSFAYAHKAVATITSENATGEDQESRSATAKSTRAGYGDSFCLARIRSLRADGGVSANERNRSRQLAGRFNVSVMHDLVW